VVVAKRRRRRRSHALEIRRNHTGVSAIGWLMPIDPPDFTSAVVDLDPSAPDLLQEEEARHREGEDTETLLRRSLYQPSEELRALSGTFLGVAIEVHRHLGPGFTEVIYHRGLCRELDRRRIPYQSEVQLDVTFKGDVLGTYRVDLIIDERLLVEIKAVDRISSVHVAQAISYLRATNLGLALIVNFNVPRLKDGGVRRVVW
jgi:GxxExxY protein